MNNRTLGRPKSPKTPKNTKKLNWAAAIQKCLKKNSQSLLAGNVESLSKKIGTSRTYLYNIIAGRIQEPASNKLLKISDALGISFLEFTQMALEDGPHRPFHTTFNQIPVIDFHQHGFTIQSLSNSRNSFRDFFLGIMRIKPKREIKKWQFKEDCSVCLFVETGTLEITLGNQTWRVLSNEAFSFDGASPHKIKNIDPHYARVIVVTRPPLF